MRLKREAKGVKRAITNDQNILFSEFRLSPHHPYYGRYFEITQKNIPKKAPMQRGAGPIGNRD
jgi:hypothetical protein